MLASHQGLLLFILQRVVIRLGLSSHEDKTPFFV